MGCCRMCSVRLLHFFFFFGSPDLNTQLHCRLHSSLLLISVELRCWWPAGSGDVLEVHRPTSAICHSRAWVLGHFYEEDSCILLRVHVHRHVPFIFYRHQANRDGRCITGGPRSCPQSTVGSSAWKGDERLWRMGIRFFFFFFLLQAASLSAVSQWNNETPFI